MCKSCHKKKKHHHKSHKQENVCGCNDGKCNQDCRIKLLIPNSCTPGNCQINGGFLNKNNIGKPMPYNRVINNTGNNNKKY